MRFDGRGILLDIEGTMSSVSFVFDVMFPYARRELLPYLLSNWHAPPLKDVCNLIAREAGHASLAAWCGGESDLRQQQYLATEVHRLMDADIKSTGLKELQGMIWERGFADGELESHVFDDVPIALAEWKRKGLDIRVYSSGSITAQHLFFRHSVAGDLLPYFNGHYDTTTGPKKQSESYRQIAADFGLPASEILFISDVVEELDAAHHAGLQTVLSRRPGNAAVAAGHGHAEISSFAEIEISQ